MVREALQQKVMELLPEAVPEVGGDWLNVQVDAARWPAFARRLATDGGLRFDYLFCLTCIDWKTHLTMVYHLDSTEFRHQLVIKIKLDREHPEVETVCDVWHTAAFHEREVFEMFGVRFTGHPDLRLLILPDGWEGKNPLRKDFEDPVNMIRL